MSTREKMYLAAAVARTNAIFAICDAHLNETKHIQNVTAAAKRHYIARI
jgi:hypothetical protein